MMVLASITLIPSFMIYLFKNEHVDVLCKWMISNTTESFIVIFFTMSENYLFNEFKT